MRDLHLVAHDHLKSIEEAVLYARVQFDLLFLLSFIIIKVYGGRKSFTS